MNLEEKVGGQLRVRKENLLDRAVEIGMLTVGTSPRLNDAMSRHSDDGNRAWPCGCSLEIYKREHVCPRNPEIVHRGFLDGEEEAESGQMNQMFYAKDKLADHVQEALELRFRGTSLGLFRYSLLVTVPVSEVEGAIEVWKRLDAMFPSFPKVPLQVIKTLLKEYSVNLTARDFVDAAGWKCGDDNVVHVEPPRADIRYTVQDFFELWSSSAVGVRPPLGSPQEITVDGTIIPLSSEVLLIDGITIGVRF